jgi:hypothetical protein
MAKRNFHLAPPETVRAEAFDRGRDVFGNPTAHYLLTWDNGRTGRDWDGGTHRTRRRVQVGYRDKASGGAIGLALDLFPGTAWRLVEGSLSETRDGATLTLERDRDHESETVIFRADRETGETVAFFPHESWDWHGETVASYAETGEHGGASPDYYRTQTRPASPEAVARLRSILEGRGYRLETRKRWTPQMDEKRRALLDAARQFDQGEAV